jgi:ribosomal protein S17
MAKKEKTKVEAREIANAKINRIVGTRGKIFEGLVTKKFQKRVVIEFERMIYVKKYERYAKLKTKIHARLPEALEKEINLGDLIRVHECRPLSKIIHFVVIQKIKDVKEVGK